MQLQKSVKYRLYRAVIYTDKGLEQKPCKVLEQAF